MNNIIVVVGIGWQQKKSILYLKKLNYIILGIDNNANPFCKRNVDYFINVNTDDITKCFKLIKKYTNGPKYIFSFVSDKTMLSASLLREKFNLDGIKPYQVKKLINKKTQKIIFTKNRINIPNYELISKSNLQINFNSKNYIAKPIDGSGSRGVFLLDKKINLITAFNNSIKYSKKKQIIIEEFIKGGEFSVESIYYNKKTYILSIFKRKKYNNTSASEIYSVNLGSEKENLIKQYLNLVFKSFNINNLAYHSEIIINKNSDIFLIDIAGRAGGFMVSDGLVSLSTAYNVNKFLIDIALKNKILIPRIYKRKFVYIKYLKLKKGIFDSYKNNNKKIIKNISFKIFLKKGDIINDYVNDSSRSGYLIVVAQNLYESKKIAKNYINNLKFIIR